MCSPNFREPLTLAKDAIALDHIAWAAKNTEQRFGFMASQVALGFAVYHANYWVAVPLVFVTSHLMHAMLIGFHEATHGLLRKSRVLNEIDGIIIGTLSLMSFSLYRAAHQLHHAYLASERDEELWPFVHPQMSRAARVSAVTVVA